MNRNANSIIKLSLLLLWPFIPGHTNEQSVAAEVAALNAINCHFTGKSLIKLNRAEEKNQTASKSSQPVGTGILISQHEAGHEYLNLSISTTL